MARLLPLLAALVAPAALALNNGLARLPALGWNTCAAGPPRAGPRPLTASRPAAGAPAASAAATTATRRSS